MGPVAATLSHHDSSLFFDGELSLMLDIVFLSLRKLKALTFFVAGQFHFEHLDSLV